MPKAKRGSKPIKCEKCSTEFSDDKAMEYPGKVYVHKDKVYCEDCLVDMGVMPNSADPYSVYMKTQTDLGKDAPGMGGVL